MSNQKPTAPAAASVHSALNTRLAFYRVVSPLNHDGERYQVGAEVQLSADQAAPLLGHTVQPLG